MSQRKAQLGCLTMLLLFVGLGMLAEHFRKPGDNEGGGVIAALALVLFILFFVIFGAVAVVVAIFNRLGFKTQREPRGFPVVPNANEPTVGSETSDPV